MPFLSTPSARRATESLRPGRRPCNFYPRPPRGGRHHPPGSGHPRKNFYPRPPRGGRLMSMPSCVEIGNFYPRPPRGGRPAVAGIPRQVCEQISIHALREEGDSYAYRWTSGPQHFYPRPPRGGRPSRQIPTISAPDNFYPRPPRGGRPSSQLVGTMLPKFLSTPSARRATQRFFRPMRRLLISIHALREEGDKQRPVRRRP